LIELRAQIEGVPLKEPSYSDPYQWYVELLISRKEMIPYKISSDELGPRVIVSRFV